MAKDTPKFGLFSIGSEGDPNKDEKNMSHNASLFGTYMPDETPEAEVPAESPYEQKFREKALSELFGHIGSLADLVDNGLVIDLEDEENADLIVEILQHILPYISAGMIELLKSSSDNLLALLERIRDLLLHDPDKAIDLITELLLEEIEKRMKEKGHGKDKKVKILGNRRKVGLSFEDDLDEDAQKALEELAKELQKLLDKKQGKGQQSAAAKLDLNAINPRGTTAERLTFQLSASGGAMMTVLISYLLRYGAPAILNTIARGNPHLRGLMTQFDTLTLQSQSQKSGQNQNLWQNKGPEKGNSSDPSAGNTRR